MVHQAEAIGARRFVAAGEPRAPEFRVVARALNVLSDRVRHMLDADAQRLDALRRATHLDAVTGLATREQFLAMIRTALEREDAGAAGALVVASLSDLRELNRARGWEATDALLRRAGDAITTLANTHPGCVPGRISGSELAILAPMGTDAAVLAREVSQTVAGAMHEPDAVCEVQVRVVDCRPGESLEHVLDRAQRSTLGATAERSGTQVVPANFPGADQMDPGVLAARIDAALVRAHVSLDTFPVVDRDGAPMHETKVSGDCASSRPVNGCTGTPFCPGSIVWVASHVWTS